MVVLLLRINKTTIFILPMTEIVAEEAENDIIKNHKNMYPITQVENCEFDPYIIKDEIDTIINCLFFTRI